MLNLILQYQGQKKTDPTQVSKEKLINTYDNSILYTDYIITSAIEQLKDKNAIVIYSSDHGELMGEYGKFGHGHEKIEEFQQDVPLIIWASDRFKKENPGVFESIRKKSGQWKHHNNIFHTILSIAGIKSDCIDEKLNLCNK